MSDQEAAESAIALQVEGPNPAAEISLYDHSFKLQETGIGRIETRLSAGLYSLEVSLGNHRERKVFALSTPLVIGADDWKLRIHTAVPSRHSGSGTQEETAIRESGAPTLSAGRLAGESRLFVFVRKQERARRDGPSSAAQPPWASFRLRTADGRQVCDFSNGVTGDAESGCYALTVDLAEGGYVLSASGARDDDLCIPLWLQPRFETHVFVPVDERPDFDASTVSMAPKGAGFSPSAQQETEYAAALLAGFRRGTNPINPTYVRAMLESKLHNPFCGIVAAHALLRAEQPDRVLLQELISTLRGLLGNHPDVIALDLMADSRSDVTVAFPPLLRAGLDGALARAASETTAIDMTPLMSEVLGRRIRSQYTVWPRPPAADWRQFAAVRDTIQNIGTKVSAFLGSLARGDLQTQEINLEKTVGSFESWLQATDAEELARQCGLPRVIVDEMTARILALLPAAKRLAAGPIKTVRVPIGITDHRVAELFELVAKLVASSTRSVIEQRAVQLIVSHWENSSKERNSAREASRWQRRLIVIAGAARRAHDLLEPDAPERTDAMLLAATLAGLGARLYPFLLVGRGLDILLASVWCTRAAGAQLIGPAGDPPLGPALPRMLRSLLSGAGQADYGTPVVARDRMTLKFLRLEFDYWAAEVDMTMSPLSTNPTSPVARPSDEWIDERLAELIRKIEPATRELVELVRVAIEPLGPTRPALERLPRAITALCTELQNLIRQDGR